MMFYAKEKIAILPDSVCSKSLKSPSTLWIPQHHHLQEYHRHQAERDHHYCQDQDHHHCQDQDHHHCQDQDHHHCQDQGPPSG